MRYGTLGFDGFDWDEGNTLKIKDRLPIKQIELFFKQSLFIKEDRRHSLSEEQWVKVKGVDVYLLPIQ